MAILLKSEIKKALHTGQIVVNPFYEQALTPNGYDLHLGRNIYKFDPGSTRKKDFNGFVNAVDIKDDPSRHFTKLRIPDYGLLMMPGDFILGVTVEYTESHGILPMMEGNSSNARFSLQSHLCAGFGDIGFKGHWTLELSTLIPIRLYAGMSIGQLIWQTVEGLEADSVKYGDGVISYNNEISEEPWPVLPNLSQKPHKFIPV